MQPSNMFKECLRRIPETVLADLTPLTGANVSALAHEELRRRAALALQQLPLESVVGLLNGSTYQSWTVARVLGE